MIPCDQVVALGVDVVRVFDDGLNIVALRLFLINYNGDQFGTEDFTSMDEFKSFMQTTCECCPDTCYLFIDGCTLTIDGCTLVTK